MLWSPVWIVALVLAVGAPWFARVLADHFELRVRRRTQALVARARTAAPRYSASSASGRGGKGKGGGADGDPEAGAGIARMG